jgi:Transcriptional regulator, AbiEi antitoxin
MPQARALPDVFTFAQAAAAGFTRHQIRSRVRAGRWIVLRRGTYCATDTYDACPPNRRHVLHATAARLAYGTRDLTESHLTAAARWDLPMPLNPPERGYLTDGHPRRSTRVDRSAVVEVATLFAGELMTRGGIPLTSPARTAADCLRHYDAEVGVPIADAAIQRGLATTEAIARALGRQTGWPYGLRGISNLALVDGRRESWLESVSAVRLTRSGIPLGEPQVDVFDDRGTFLGRVDVLWAEHATLGEADGAAKYSLADWSDLSEASAAEVLHARVEAAVRGVRREKAREDALRMTGLEVVRWTTAEILGQLPEVVRRVHAAQRRGDPRRFTGRLKSAAVA